MDLDDPAFVHTVLVEARERPRNAERPGRIFEGALEKAEGGGLVDCNRRLDATALCDALPTKDTVTMREPMLFDERDSRSGCHRQRGHTRLTDARASAGFSPSAASKG
jgi:hypothetical protein